jgi:hypothetical protein
MGKSITTSIHDSVISRKPNFHWEILKFVKDTILEMQVFLHLAITQ